MLTTPDTSVSFTLDSSGLDSALTHPSLPTSEILSKATRSNAAVDDASSGSRAAKGEEYAGSEERRILFLPPAPSIATARLPSNRYPPRRCPYPRGYCNEKTIASSLPEFMVRTVISV
ncbi:uncharacterized protein ARMOST_18944 [Armillaria ostoyae]|uniref:Uncharacterized protein n=1 Tax=Armillaria ostoyae TaxID=47428 RepID=A0A284S385_ARMOS|nr:uncharacterized protein ARMOST_18944 [Armillaria ostoyae]